MAAKKKVAVAPTPSTIVVAPTIEPTATVITAPAASAPIATPQKNKRPWLLWAGIAAAAAIIFWPKAPEPDEETAQDVSREELEAVGMDKFLVAR